MNVQELYDSVAKLGFESMLEDEMAFFQATNRAIMEINKIRPLVKTVEVVHHPLKNIIKGSNHDTQNVNGEPIIFSGVRPLSFSFEASGSGTYNLYKNTKDGRIWLSQGVIDGPKTSFKEYRGFVFDVGTNAPVAEDTEVEIEFSGEYFYQIRNVAFFDALLSEPIAANVKDIPVYKKFLRYDISTMVDDFLLLSSPPMDNGDVLVNRDYFIEGTSTLLIPYDNADGAYVVKYERSPKKLSIPDNREEWETINIDLVADLAELVPLLVAAYIWADDEPEKAEYYLNRYMVQARSIENKERIYAPIVYRNVNGW